jgi:hypothetical protein
MKKLRRVFPELERKHDGCIKVHGQCYKCGCEIYNEHYDCSLNDGENGMQRVVLDSDFIVCLCASCWKKWSEMWARHPFEDMWETGWKEFLKGHFHKTFVFR